MAVNKDKKTAFEIALGDKSVWNFITGSGLAISALGVGLMFTGAALPIGIGMFALGEVIAIGAAYKAHQSQKEIDSLNLSPDDLKELTKEVPQKVIDEDDDIKPQVEEKSNLSPEAKELEADKSVYNFIKYLGIAMAVLGIVLAVVTGASIVGLFIGLGMAALGGAVALGFDSLSRQAENNLDALSQSKSPAEDVSEKRPEVVVSEVVVNFNVKAAVEDQATKRPDPAPSVSEQITKGGPS